MVATLSPEVISGAHREAAIFLQADGDAQVVKRQDVQQLCLGAHRILASCSTGAAAAAAAAPASLLSEQSHPRPSPPAEACGAAEGAGRRGQEPGRCVPLRVCQGYRCHAMTAACVDVSGSWSSPSCMNKLQHWRTLPMQAARLLMLPRRHCTAPALTRWAAQPAAALWPALHRCLAPVPDPASAWEASLVGLWTQAMFLRKNGCHPFFTS